MTDDKSSAWVPFGIPVFRALWLATLASNVGTWMHDIGAGWLMTTLSPSPVMVALVQTATTLPIFLLALPAGALADIIDKRRHLVRMQVFMALVAAILALVTITGIVTPWILVGLTFAMGIGTAMMMPAWSSIVPELVPRSELPAAIALNSMGINVARAIGPALAGVIISFAGSGAVFALNALSFVGVILVLRGWQRETAPSQLPAERWLSAMRLGLRYVRHAPGLRAAILRGMSFFLFASAAWALLPLVAKHLVNGGPQAFGILMASIGAGAVAGAFVLPGLRRLLSRDVLVAGASLLYAACLFALASFDRLWPLTIVMALSGMAWITVLSSLQVAAQMALPNWVRSRGLAVFMSAFMGSMAFGSLCWGKLAELLSIEQSLSLAGAGAIVAVLLSWRWKIDGMDDLDLSPSMHWPSPPVVGNADRGPVLVTIEYVVRPDAVPRFVELLNALSEHRKRDGAYNWSLFEHTEKPFHYIETLNDESWLAHLRTHERVTGEVKRLQAQINECLEPGTQARITHYVAPEATQKRG